MAYPETESAFEEIIHPRIRNSTSANTKIKTKTNSRSTSTSTLQATKATKAASQDDAEDDDDDGGRPSIAATLAQLHHERKNQSFRRLNCSTHSISRRPIQHAPIASPFAGSNVPKVVYVSSKTPLMAAVKRVRKFLRQIEKREGQSVRLVQRGEREGMRRLVEERDRTKKGKEKERVVVKASGRAMAKAVAVGRWFEEKEREWLVSVEVTGGSVSTVDDVVQIGEEVSDDDDDDDDDDEEGEEEDENGENGEADSIEKEKEGETMDTTATTTILEGGDTTMELLGAAREQQKAAAAAAAAAANASTATGNDAEMVDADANADADADAQIVAEGRTAEQSASMVSAGQPAPAPAPSKKRRRKRARKRRAFYDADDVPEQRLRWIKTVDVAISFKA